LPGTRAVVGGLLVVVAAIGAYTVATSGSGRPSTSYVVAATPIAPGEALTGDDLAVVAIDLPASTASGAFTDPDELEGAVSLAALQPGDLLTRSTVAAGTSAPTPHHEVSFAVEKARALDGRLQLGERVGVLATYGTGDAAITLSVVEAATVVHLSGADDTLGSTGTITVALALGSADQAIEVTHAAEVGALTLTRSAGTGDVDDPAPVPYRTPRSSSSTVDGPTSGTSDADDDPDGGS
jgi:Flp pilus assembly protein CpaB